MSDTSPIVPAEVNLSFYRGASPDSVAIELKDENGQPINLASWQGKSECRSTAGGPLRFTNNVQLVENNSKFLVTPPSDAPVCSGMWDFFAINPQGVVLGPIVYGEMKVLPPITELL